METYIVRIAIWLSSCCLFALLGYWYGVRKDDTQLTTNAVTATEHEQVRTITRTVVLKEPTPAGTRETTTTTETQVQNRVDKTKSVDSQPVAQQRQERSKYSVGVLVTPRVDETWRDSYKPTAVELGYRVGDTPVSAIGSYDWRRREFQWGVRVEW